MKMSGVDQLALNVRLRTDATFEAFVPAEGQDELILGLREFAHGRGAESQWYLWGAPQRGKTHLAQAACHAAAAAGMASVYLPLREFAPYGVDMLDGLDALDLLAVDDVDAVWGDAHWARGLFALINAARERGSRLLFTAQALPPDGVLPDLRSRLLWGPVYQLQRLSDDGLRQLVSGAAAARGLSLGDSEVGYLLRHGPREPMGVIQLLERLDQASLRAKRRVTVPFIREVFEAAGEGSRRLSPDV